VIAVKLPIGQPMTIEGYTITFLKVIEDSRCPKNVECVWAGMIQVLVEIEDENNNTSQEKLVFQGQQLLQNDSNFSLELKEQKLSFIGVKPYPNASSSIEPDEYRLLIGKQKRSE